MKLFSNVARLVELDFGVALKSFPTSRLCYRRVGGGLHGHGRPVADGGGREIGEARLASHSLAPGTAAVTERVLDDGLAEGLVRDGSAEQKNERQGGKSHRATC